VKPDLEHPPIQLAPRVRIGWPLLVTVFLAATRVAGGATVLFAPLGQFDGWDLNTLGTARIAAAPSAAGLPCVEMNSAGGTCLLSRALPLDQMRGSRVTIRCLARSDGVVRGPQASSTAKIHLAIRTPRGIEHHSARFLGNTDWHPEAITADVPADAQQTLLHLGLEACRGRAWFSQLLVRNDRPGMHAIPLDRALNADHAQLGLDVFPTGRVTWRDIGFELADPTRNEHADCLRLRGEKHLDWPIATSAPIRVGSGATSIYILHGALEGNTKSDSPCAIWTARFADGQESTFSVFEGRDIGPVGTRDDCPNWHVAWHENDAAGRRVSFGVTHWKLPQTSPVMELECRAYRGGSPVVLALTAVEDPQAVEPKRIADPEADER
jgi:hypothetical protein